MKLGKLLDGKKVRHFLWIDRMGEGFGITAPLPDEEFYYNYEFHGDHASECIIVRNKKTKAVKSICNVVDMAEIKFEGA